MVITTDNLSPWVNQGFVQRVAGEGDFDGPAAISSAMVFLVNPRGIINISIEF